ncbi:Acetylcholinesterase [Strongyloides ratti]|uniref:Acetylcholinesterase n=1 Tax=Strongyloides ratti TaxID=34506 RepID=A0A090KYF7_STRRB|nr:Acetylcholinesterase [Strongyloides ratti]CEF60213.1 Acetylcholinesterase [Strongyloides ratti]
MIFLQVFLFFQLQYFIIGKILYLSNDCFRGRKAIDYPDVYEFYGIPYALPPLKQYRFLPPKPTYDTRGMYGARCIDANVRAKTCIFTRTAQNFSKNDIWSIFQSEMSEDCLQLNMWIPRKPAGPVLVHFVGPNYEAGNSYMPYSDGSILAHMTKTIVITVHYRVGVFGFALMGKKSKVPGNMGLLDQQLALKYIYKNIDEIGGDRRKITIFGHGTDGASATAHLFSEESKRYFSKVIAFSGTITHDWALEKKKAIVYDNFNRLAEAVGCDRFLEDKVLKCMQKIDAEILSLEADQIYNLEQSILKYPFLPIDNDRKFFKSPIKRKLKFGDFKRNVSIVIGKSSDEGSLGMVQYLNKKKYGCQLNYKKPANNKLNQCKMNKKQYDEVFELVARDADLKRKAVPDLQNIYKPKKPTNDERRNTALRLISDIAYDCDYIKFSGEVSGFLYGNEYFFNFKKRLSRSKWPKWMGVVRGEELLYLFGHSYKFPFVYDRKKLEDEQNFSRQAMKTLFKFLNTGKLYKSWKPFNPWEPYGVDIDRYMYPYEHFASENVTKLECFKIGSLLQKEKSPINRRFISDYLNQG